MLLPHELLLGIGLNKPNAQTSLKVVARQGTPATCAARYLGRQSDNTDFLVLMCTSVDVYGMGAQPKTKHSPCQQPWVDAGYIFGGTCSG